MNADMGLLTTAEVAARLGVSPRRVRAMITARRIPAIRYGRDWLISPRHLERVAIRKPGRPPGKRRRGRL